ncbi:MAG: hypothetical protein WAW39_20850 [Prosthecobacter sp.]|uniref:hypothetical protein n=1 Tax=Prosthecobacter sp. TaxID=1965333 RepID=UPI003BAE654C
MNPPFTLPASAAVQPKQTVGTRTIRVTLDIPEADLAHRWADVTWEGRTPTSIEEIIAGDLKASADTHRALVAESTKHTGLAEHRILTAFRTAHPNLVTVF